MQTEYRDSSRPTRQQSMMDTAYIWAARSTCSRLHVGCVLHRDWRILVQGYNGAPAGLNHCNHDCNCDKRKYITQHSPSCPSVTPCLRSVHAEQNAISFAARWGVELEGAMLSVTHQPCVSCAQSIINAGIKFVMYQEPYRLVDGLELLREAGIEVMGGLWAPSPSHDRMAK